MEPVLLKTWICGSCDYQWQFTGDAVNASPYELTYWQLTQQFPGPQFDGLQAGKCPSCHLRGISSPLGLSIDPGQMSRMTVAQDDELEQTLRPEVDQYGQAVMVETDDGFEQKMRELTTQELEALKEQRDENLRKLEDIAV